MRIQKIKTLTDVFPDWMTGGGIFTALQNFDVPWKDEDIASSLDLEYYGNVSGDKFISPLVTKLMDGEELTTLEINLLATAIMAVNGTNWGKLWETLDYDYDPIQNYKMTEIMTDDETVIEYGKSSTRTDDLTHRKTGTETLDTDADETRTDNLKDAKTGTETRTDDLTIETTPDLLTTTNDSVYGFNSSDATPTDDRTQSATGTNTETDTGTVETEYDTEENHTGTQRVIKDNTDETTYNTTETETGTQGTVDSGSDTHTRNYTLTREGNIGVTTSQQMIESERNLWLWNFFRNVVFPDVDKILALRIY